MTSQLASIDSADVERVLSAVLYSFAPNALEFLLKNGKPEGEGQQTNNLSDACFVPNTEAMATAGSVVSVINDDCKQSSKRSDQQAVDFRAKVE